MSKNILIRRVLVQIDDNEPFLTTLFNRQLIYTEMLPSDLNRRKKVNNMSQLLSLYKYIPNAELTKTLFNKQVKIKITYYGNYSEIISSISITEKFFKKHTLTLHFEYEPQKMTLKDVINTFDMDTALEIINDRMGAKVNKKIIKEFL